jgi:hypothetical protein
MEKCFLSSHNTSLIAGLWLLVHSGIGRQSPPPPNPQGSKHSIRLQLHYNGLIQSAIYDCTIDVQYQKLCILRPKSHPFHAIHISTVTANLA